jgi:hypothetical protein
MAGNEGNRIDCAEFDALLSQAIDGTLVGQKLAWFQEHRRQCQVCGPLAEEVEAGRRWLKSLEELEPPRELVARILVRTSGFGVAPSGARSAAASWAGRIRQWAGTISAPVAGVARQPRFAMSFAMAFFALSISLSLAGVRLGDLRHLDLRPSAIRRTYYETAGRAVKYYDNIRFVYEIQSRVRQFREATAPPAPPADERKKDQKDGTKNNSSGQPEPRQERNYSWEGEQTVLASLSYDPPVVTGANYGRML